MHPILFKLGPFTVYSYGFMIALAFLAGIALASYLAKRDGIDPDKIFDLAVWVLVSSIIGARVFYVLEFIGDFAKDPLSALYLWQGGMVFFGGVAFAIIAVAIWSRVNKINVLKLLDAIAPATALGYAIGRIGCFLRGCCYGTETSLPWGVQFPDACGVRHPTQIYSSLSGLLMMALLLLVLSKRKFDGQVFSAGLMLYSVYRFLIEFIRTNPKYLFSLSEGQWGSVLIFICGAGLYYYFRKQS
ncbi:MAG TPA: prolipoprotein diacylglyceryl transferase [Candidatus Omnitrophota bacterium]|nr:prolipoprotein diacylglyceryl transferase [Candidatus Omnitrophota bacterium]